MQVIRPTALLDVITQNPWLRHGMGRLSMMKLLLKLLREDRGAITADWLALVCGVTLLAVAVTVAIEDELAVLAGIDAGISAALK